MTDRDLPVTEDELHAYVDGEIARDRRFAVEAWLAAHPDDAARVAEWRLQAEALRARFSDVATEPVPARFNLDRLSRPRRPWGAIAATALIAASLGAVVGWFAHGVTGATPSNFERFTREAIEAHKLYVVEVRHPVEVPGDEREHLVQWLSKRLSYDLRAPDLRANGLNLVGGRLLPGVRGEASAFFMYEGASGERFTLYCSHSAAPETGMRYRAEDPVAAFYWVDRGLAYVVSGPSDRQKLWAITKAAYDQIENAQKPAGG